MPTSNVRSSRTRSNLSSVPALDDATLLAVVATIEGLGRRMRDPNAVIAAIVELAGPAMKRQRDQINAAMDRIIAAPESPVRRAPSRASAALRRAA